MDNQTTVKILNIQSMPTFETTFKDGTVALLYGPNSSGKTSIINALRALVTGVEDPLKLGSFRVKDYAMLGKDSSRAELLRDNYNCVWQPTASPPITLSGNVLSGAAAVGMEDLLGSTSYEKGMAMWERCLGGEVIDRVKLLNTISMLMFNESSFDDLKSERDSRHCESTVNTILTRGWDEAMAEYKRYAIEAKRDWREAVAAVDPQYGSAYGEKKAANWIPPALTDMKMMGIGVSEARDKLSEAEAVLAQAIAMSSMTVLRREQIDLLCKERDELESEIDPIKSEIDENSKLLSNVLTKASRLRETQKGMGATIAALELTISDHRYSLTKMSCPSCNAELLLVGEELKLYSDEVKKQEKQAEEVIEKSNKEIERMQKKISVVDQDIIRFRKESDDLKAKISTLKSNILSKRDRIGRITDTISKAEISTETVRDDFDDVIGSAKDECNRAKEVLRNVEALGKATEAHSSASYATKIINHLKASGIRKMYWEKRLDRVMHGVDICRRRIGLSKIDNVLGEGLYYGGINVRLAASNERWFVRALLQCAIASVMGHRFVILDGLEVVTADRFKDLFKTLVPMAAKTGLVIVIGYACEDGERKRLCGEYLYPIEYKGV